MVPITVIAALQWVFDRNR